jgi:acyl transferase domain-containing protein
VGTFDAPKRAWKKLGVTGAGWGSFVVSAPVELVKAALAKEPLAHLTIINTPEDCVIAGEVKACERVLDQVGRERSLPLGYELAAHCPEVEEIREAWWQLHHRAATPVPGVRFYSNATNAAFTPTSEGCADAITGQALRTLDFPRTIEQAWNDGVRVFVEHGPRGLCSGWIRRILGDREHLVVPLDVAGRSGPRQLLNATAALVSCAAEAAIRSVSCMPWIQSSAGLQAAVQPLQDVAVNVFERLDVGQRHMLVDFVDGGVGRAQLDHPMIAQRAGAGWRAPRGDIVG